MKKLLLCLLFICTHTFLFGSPTHGCVGGTYDFSSPPSVHYTCSDTTQLTIDFNTGTAHAVSAGTVDIYRLDATGTLISVSTFTINPAIIQYDTTLTGPSHLCLYSTITLSSTYTGYGIWASSNVAVATVVPMGTGAVLGVSTDTATITYTHAIDTATCSVLIEYKIVTVDSTAYAGVISGPSVFYDAGLDTTYVSTMPGGTWGVTNWTCVYINPPTGLLAALSCGSTNILYIVNNSCGADTATFALTVFSGITSFPISGPSSVMTGYSISLTESVGGGVWSVTPATVASIDVATGVITGLSAGSCTVTYTVGSCYSPSFTTYDMTVVPADVISGTVQFGAGAYTGNVKLWLIGYAAPMLSAVDSVTVTASGTSVPYQFFNEPAGAYRVKAAVTDGLLTGTGYVPTYHSSSFYWNTADVFSHAASTIDAGKDINMAYGTVTSGPGFIAGDVTTGANKGTTTSVPVNHLMMYLFDATTSTLIQSARTDATGHYSFSDLPIGTYFVFPDSLNYLTTPYTGINLTTSVPSFSSASFVQHTLSHTITPIPEGISSVTAAGVSVTVFPNPTNGKVNIAWQSPVTEAATLVVTDVTGRVVYTAALNITAGKGNMQADLAKVTSGLYTLSLKGKTLNYNTKVQVTH